MLRKQPRLDDAPDFAALAARLDTDGVVVVPLPGISPEELWNRVTVARSEFPEFLPPTTVETQQVLGGFGALGNPSSFHHPDIRYIRGLVKRNVAMPLFREWAKQKEGVRVEALFDRLCVRARAFGKPSPESWHRDTYDHAKYDDTGSMRLLHTGDTVWGGWLNCNENAAESDKSKRWQYFSHVPGTHRDYFLHGGFAAEPDTSTCEERKRLLAVPPGHVVIFMQGLLHEVVSGTQPDLPSIRLFVGHRVTTDAVPLFPELGEWIRDQAVPRIPSGQRPPMFSVHHYSTLAKGGPLTIWGRKTFNPAFLTKKTSSGGVEYWSPSARGDRSMESLATYGQGMLPPYTEDERQVMMPERV